MLRRTLLASVVTAGALALGLSACGSTTPAGRPHAPSSSTSSAASTTSAPATRAPSTTASSATTGTAPAAPTTSLLVYFLRGAYLGVARVEVPSTTAVGKASVDALLAGPGDAQRAAGLSSAVPAGARLVGLRISSGTATADFNAAYATAASPASELQRVAEVVFTLTQFPTVSRVLFQVDGVTPAVFGSGAVDLARPLGRHDVLGAVPAILLEHPAVGDALHGSLHLTGIANVFEAQFRAELIDGAGHVLVDGPVHASAGSGTWGGFDTTFRFTVRDTTTGTLKVYARSMKDGSPIDEVDLHLPVGP